MSYQRPDKLTSSSRIKEKKRKKKPLGVKVDQNLVPQQTTRVCRPFVWQKLALVDLNLFPLQGNESFNCRTLCVRVE